MREVWRERTTGEDSQQWEKDSGVGLKEVGACGNGVQNPKAECGKNLSVVQTPVEVTESSLSCKR